MSSMYSLGSAAPGLRVPPVNSQPRSLYSASAPRQSMVSANAAIHGNGSNAYQNNRSYSQKSDYMLSSTNSDLERLERLKREILEGQNPYYQPVPRPDYLESLYLGRRSSMLAAQDVQTNTAQSKYQDAPKASNSSSDDKQVDVITSFRVLIFIAHTLTYSLTVYQSHRPSQKLTFCRPHQLTMELMSRQRY